MEGLAGIAGLAAIAFLAGALAVRRPLAPLSPWLFLCLGAGALWTAGDFVASRASGLPAKYAGLAALYTGSAWLPSLWLVTVVRWVHLHGRGPCPLGRVWERAPLALGAFLWLFVAASPFHGQLIEPVLGGRNEYRWGFYLLAGAGYAQVLVAAGLCLQLGRVHTSRPVRRASALLCAASLGPLALNAVYVFPSWGDSDLTGIVLSLSSGLVLLAIWGARALWLLPVALSEVVARDRSGLAVLGRGGALVYANRAFEELLPGIAPDPDAALLPRIASRLSEDADAAPGTGVDLERALQEAGSSGRIYRRAGGDGAWLRLSAFPLTDRRNRPRATVVRVEDVGAAVRAAEVQRRLVRRALESEKARSLGQLAGAIAHGFNNRLAVVLTNATLARRVLAPDPPYDRWFLAIERACEEATALTQELLAVGGRAPPVAAPLNVPQLVADVAHEVQGLAPGTLALATDVGEDLPRVEADPMQIRRVLLTLARAAVARVGEGPGCVGIRAGAVQIGPSETAAYEPAPEPGTFLCFEIADDGPALGDRARRDLFDPFAEGGDIETTLELAAAAGLVRSNGGSLAVASGGSGTVLRVILPVAPEPRRAQGVQVQAPEAWRRGGRALVVDDERDVRDATAAALEQLGFAVLAASGGREALEIVTRARGALRLVVLDVVMPDLRGEEVLRRMQRIDPELRFVVTSGFADTDFAALAESKHTIILPKPYRLEGLERAVAQVLCPRGERAGREGR